MTLTEKFMENHVAQKTGVFFCKNNVVSLKPCHWKERSWLSYVLPSNPAVAGCDKRASPMGVTTTGLWA